MAARHLYPVQSPASMNWSASTWALTDGGTADEVKPAAGDTVNFTANSGDVTLDEGSAALIEFDMTDYAGTLALGDKTLTVDGPCDLYGTITGTGTIDAGEWVFVQYATVANTVTLLLTNSTGSVSIFWAGTGGNVNINCTGTYTLQTPCNSYALTMTAGTLAGGAQTWTVGAGGFTFTNGTISGTLTVGLSAAAGAYVQTNGTIATGAILNVTTGTGAITYTALTKTGTGAINVTIGDNVNIGWASADASRIDTLTINTGRNATQTGTVVFSKLAGPGTLTAGAQRSDWLPSAAGDWAFTGTTTGTHAQGVRVSPQTTPLTITNAVNIGSRVFNLYATQSKTLTIPGLACGDLAVNSVNADQTGTLILTGNSSGAAIALGAGTNRYGIVTFGSGFVHRWTGAIAYGGTGTANALNPQGRCIFTGTFTGTGIVVTPTYEGQIDCGGFGRVTAVTSTGRRLIVRRAKDASGNPVRAWNGDGSTNVMYKGRKVIGEPGIN